MPTELCMLTCGELETTQTLANPELLEIVRHLQVSLDYVIEELQWLGTQDTRRIASLGPFLGRSLIEIAITILIGRLDPLRLFVVRRIQEQPSYNPHEKWKSAIRWQGDVLADKVQQPWDPKQEYKNMPKALLGDYYEELIWRPAVTRILDFELLDGAGAWISEIRAASPEQFVPKRRTEINQIYAALSKGVHQEFVMPPGAQYDRNTIVDLVQRAVHAVADLAFASHFIPHAPFRLSINSATEIFTQLETIEVLK